MGMKSDDQAGTGDAGPMQPEDMRTIGALRTEAPSAEVIARLSDRLLRAAAQNPDHSEAGRAAAAEVLRSRGVILTPWAVAAASFIDAKDLTRGEALFFGASARFRRALGGLAVLAALALIAAAASSAFDQSLARAAMVGCVWATLAFSGLWLAASLFRRHPARLCYFRDETKDGAGRFVRELAPYGHVIGYRAGEPGRVRDAASYRNAVAGLRNRLLLNLRTLLSDRETLSFSAAPAWAAMMAELLARSSDALIVDVSHGAPPQWSEIEPQASRCVFVSAWGRHQEAEAALAALGVAGPCFFYAPDGEIQRRRQFRAAILAAMRAAHPA
jgi:hypothetical protein